MISRRTFLQSSLLMGMGVARWGSPTPLPYSVMVPDFTGSPSPTQRAGLSQPHNSRHLPNACRLVAVDALAQFVLCGEYLHRDDPSAW
ncbi:MAG UNVERIFIED_CONTAM: hypothetical protein LVT10_16640 [Anaerolineae bacterium]